MLLTIHNLPGSTRYADVKSLLKDKCGLTEVIVDNLVNEGKSKKVTVGLATEDDGAFVVRKLNGLFINGQQLYIEDKRRPTADQPYRPGGLDPVQPNTMMQPVLAPVVPAWNQTVSMPYMQPMPVDQTVVKSEKSSRNNAGKGTEHSLKNTEKCKVEPGTSSNVRIKTELYTPASGRTNADEGQNDSSDFEPISIKNEPPDEIMPATFEDFKFEIPNEKSKKDEPEPKNTHHTHTEKLTVKKDHIPFKEEKKMQGVPAPNKIPSTNRKENRLKEENNQVRHRAAAYIARKIIEPNLNGCCGKRKHRLKCNGHGFEKYILKRIKAVVFERIGLIFGNSLYSFKDLNSVVQQYTVRFGIPDPFLYNEMHEKGLKEYKPPTLPKPTVDTSQFPTLMPPDWQTQYLIGKEITEIESQL